MRPRTTSGVLIVDKARGPTSHDVVAAVRRALRTREVGHAGTLDPMATGVLVVAIGEATKLVPYLTSSAKEYEARVTLGRATDTLDALGRTTEEQPLDVSLLRALSGEDPERLERALSTERARTRQLPPVYSAIHVDGERAHVLARRGDAVTLDERPVHVHALTLTSAGHDPTPHVDVRVTADKGYFVRSLGRDLALALGTVGHLSELRRVRSGDFSVDEALALPAAPETMGRCVMSLDLAARRVLPCVVVDEDGVRDAGFGRTVTLERFEGELSMGEPSAWVDAEGKLVAIGILAAEGGRVVRGFGRPGGGGP